MLLYNLKIALTSLRRNPVLTALLIGGIALGICVSTSFVTLRHMFEQDLLPGKSDRVFYVRLDNWSKDGEYPSGQTIPDQISYRDALNLRNSPVPVRQTASYITRMFVHPENRNVRPYQPDVRLAYSDFFDIFQLRFRYGGPWTKAVEAKPEQVVVIDAETNEKLFGGENSVGKMLRLEDRQFRIVGVLEPYRPPVRIWELFRNPLGPPEPIYLPFTLAEPLEIWGQGNNSSWRPETIERFSDLRSAERLWLQYWVELPDSGPSKAAYAQWLKNYIDDQQKIGRFVRSDRYMLSTIDEIKDEMGLVPKPVTAMSVVSLLFLAVCSLNLVGMLLGKFLGRIPEVSVRRALGASRAQIFWQHVIECELIGVLGGAVGIVLSLGILGILARFMPNGEALRLDGEMLLVAGFLSLVAGLLAGVYPAWRVCSVPPAMQLKIR